MDLKKLQQGRENDADPEALPYDCKDSFRCVFYYMTPERCMGKGSNGWFKENCKKSCCIESRYYSTDGFSCDYCDCKNKYKLPNFGSCRE